MSMRRMMLVVASLLASAGAVAGCAREQPRQETRAAAPMRVTVEPVAPVTVEDTVDAVGTVRSRAQTVLSSRIVASVLAVHVREGDGVIAGQTLVQLDSRDVRAQLTRAEAALREARSALEEVDRSIGAADRSIESAEAHAELSRLGHDRSRRLVERELIARHDHDEAVTRLRVSTAELAHARETRAAMSARRRQIEARIEQAAAEVENASVLVGYARITAPAAGIVAARTVEIGNLAAPGVPLLTIDEQRYRLEAGVHESDLPRVTLGQRAAVSIDSLDTRLDGRIGEIVPAADPQSRTVTVKIDLPSLSGLRSGLYGRATFSTGVRTVVTVPRSALTTAGQLDGVFVVERGDVVRMRLLKTGKTHGERVEVLSGLAAGDRVVVAGSEVRDGEQVVAGP
jgi:multidrug efflux pump subunit AcrA (membrane-fusion protein)